MKNERGWGSELGAGAGHSMRHTTWIRYYHHVLVFCEGAIGMGVDFEDRIQVLGC